MQLALPDPSRLRSEDREHGAHEGALPLPEGAGREAGVSRNRASGKVKPGCLPPSVLADVQRVLDGAARRLLADQLNGDPVRPASRRNGRGRDDGPDKGAALVEGEQVPVAGRDGDGGRLSGGEGV